MVSHDYYFQKPILQSWAFRSNIPYCRYQMTGSSRCINSEQHAKTGSVHMALNSQLFSFAHTICVTMKYNICRNDKIFIIQLINKKLCHEFDLILITVFEYIFLYPIL